MSVTKRPVEWREDFHLMGSRGQPVVPLLCDLSFDDDVRVECAQGIHFFITRKEAEDYP